MGGSGNLPRNLRTSLSQEARRREAALQGGATPGAGFEDEAFFIDQPFELVNFDPTGDRGRASFTFAQNGVEFGSGTFESQSALASKFDPNAEFKITGDRFNPVLEQGALRFSLPSPTALRAHTPKTPESKKLVRAPREGSLLGTAAARSLSNSDVTRSRRSGLRMPRLRGY